MIENKRAFSLAELLISLLVTSMILSATVPTLTKRAASTDQDIFKYTGNENQAYTMSPIYIGATGGGIYTIKMTELWPS